MNTPNALSEKRLNLWNQMQDLLKRAKAENRSLSADEHEQFGKMDKDLTELKAQIDTELRAAALSAEFDTTEPKPKETRGSGNERKDYDNAFGRLLRKGPGELSQAEVQLIERRGTATQIVGTDSLGGYLVKDIWSDQIDSTMKAFGGMLESGYVFKTDSGGDFKIPTDDNRTTVAHIPGENTQSIVSDETFGIKTLGAFVVDSYWIKATYEMLSDSAYDLEGYIRDRIAERIGRKLNTYLTTGAGTTEPTGVVTSSTLGKTCAAVGAVTRSEILDLIHSVDPAYRKSKSAKLMFNDATLLAIKKLTIGSGDDRPLWQPSIITGEPDKLEGYPIVINQDIASMGATNKFMIFGDFSKYWIRKVWDIAMVVSKEKYIDYRAMAYNGFARYDGLLVDTGAVKHMKNAAS